MTPSDNPYKLTIDLNTLKHLGIGLYSNIPAVVSEVVANAWDADASLVDIKIDEARGEITVSDDGRGMNRDEINERYLKVGYSKRDNESPVTPKGRHVMGRKGIGKLALFSIAKNVVVFSVKAGDVAQGFSMNSDEIEDSIRTRSSGYFPKPVDASHIPGSAGTTIVLSQLKQDAQRARSWMRKRLARRFSVIGPSHGFQVSIDGAPITTDDRDHFRKLEYLWCIGDAGALFREECKHIPANRVVHLPGDLKDGSGRAVSGWVGTVKRQDQLDDGDNAIIVSAWGKLIHEDILKDLQEGGVFSKYLIGDIRADFVDDDQLEDIATSGRQSIKEDDPRFMALKSFVQSGVLKDIQSKWREWRNEDGAKEALDNPAIKAWHDELSPDNRKAAKSLFARINSLPGTDAEAKAVLYRHGILAFESLTLNGRLSALDDLDDPKEVAAMLKVFEDIDSLEAAHYYQISKGRLRIIEKFEEILPESKEAALQNYIFDHLWLLSPAWERPTTDKTMESNVVNAFKSEAALTDAERKGRVDIKYRSAAGKHIIIELKRYARTVSIDELIRQVGKYKNAALKVLQAANPDVTDHQLEIICILGAPPTPEANLSDHRQALAAYRARWITYDELIAQARDSYREYLEAQAKIGKVRDLLESI